VVAYDFDGLEPMPAPAAHLAVSIAVSAVTAPSWLASTQLAYRLAYAPPSTPLAYTRSRWAAPPADLLTARLRALLTTANSGFTLSRGAGPGAYRLDVALEQLEQVYSARQTSDCRVTLRATVTAVRDGRVLVQRSFHAERAAVSADAAGAARGLVEGSDQCLTELLQWLAVALPPAGAP
jgi:cholesterol transport system auxiliary component